MRILLVNPPNCGKSIPNDRYGINFIKQIFRGEPYALEVLAGTLSGHDVRIVDLKAEPEAFQGSLEDFKPELVGITGVTCEANTVLRLAAQAKKVCSATVVVGGSHASCAPDFFNHADIDFVVIGIAGSSFPQLIMALEKESFTDDIPGVAKTCPQTRLSIRRRIYSQADLANGCRPRYDLVAGYRDQYTISALQLKLGFVASAYGCPHDCSFCCLSSQAGGRYLTRSLESVIEDIRLLQDLPVIRLIDANTFGNINHAEKLCLAILNAGIRKSYVADVRTDTVVSHPNLLRLWKGAGLRSVVVGFEEIKDEKLQTWRKGSRLQTNSEAIDLLHEMGLAIVGDFIISPDYGEEEFDALAKYITDKAIDVPILSVLTPLPGTALYQTVQDRVTIADLDYYTLENAVISTKMSEKNFYLHYSNLLQVCQTRAKL